MDQHNPFFITIYYNKWRFAVLGAALPCIVIFLSVMLYVDPIGLWPTLAAAAVMAGALAGGAYQWVRYRKWVKANKAELEKHCEDDYDYDA